VAENWAVYYSRPSLKAVEDWYAGEAAASKAREAAREAFARLRWKWAADKART
jgi:hypothetical protein